MKYTQLEHSVRISDEPGPRGYRIRWSDPETGADRDTTRVGYAEALSFAHGLAGAIGNFHSRPKRPMQTGRPLSDLIQWWLSPEERGDYLAPGTLRNYELNVRVNIVPHFGNPACGDITREDCARYLGRLTAGYSSGTAIQRFRTFRSLCTLGLQYGYMTTNPTDGLKAGSRRRRDLALKQGQEGTLITADEVPSHRDIQAMIERFDAHAPHLSAAILLGGYSGLRLGETLGVTPADFVREGREAWLLKVERQWTKGLGVDLPKYSKRRETMVFPTLLDIEARMEDAIARSVKIHGGWDGPLLCQDSGLHTGHSTFSDRFRSEAMALGWPMYERNDGTRVMRWGFHYLRHHFCTWALSELRLDAADVAHMAGHSNVKTTLDRYVGRRQYALERAAEAAKSWSPPAPDLTLVEGHR